MARVYSGGHILDHIECDSPGCSSIIEPGPEAVKSGWMVYSPCKDTSLYYCPDHTHLIPAYLLDTMGSVPRFVLRTPRKVQLDQVITVLEVLHEKYLT